MNVDYSIIQEGDLWFGRTNTIINKLLGDCRITTMGFIIKPFGGKLFYAAHINTNGKLRFDRLTDVSVELIRRIPHKYDILEERIKLRHRLIKIHEDLILEDTVYFGDSVALVDSETYGFDNYSVERGLDFYINSYRFITVQDGV